MSFVQLVINIDSKTADKLSDIFIELGALSVTTSDQYEGTNLEQALYTEPGYEIANLWDKSQLVVLFYSNIEIKPIVSSAAEKLGQKFAYSIQEVDDQDWVRLNKTQFAPIKINDKLYITPSWHDVPHLGVVNITLDPGLAFGTGSHPTTFMCLDWISNNVQNSTHSVLDYGCGSGILAIAAKKFGGSSVYGVDIDEQAIEASGANVGINQVDITFCRPEQISGRQFEIVIANILSNPLRILAPTLANLTHRTLILSGILESQADELIAIYQKIFAVVIVANAIDGWVLLECTKG